LSAGVIAAAVLGLIVAASFWLAYFDFASGGIEHLLAQRRGEERVALARDAYTYLHLPMVAGVLLFAFAMRTALAHVGSHLDLIPALALCCGSALYLLAFVALRWRASRTFGYGRPVAALALALVTPLATSASALVALAVVAGLWLGLHAYELIWWRDARARQRAPATASRGLPGGRTGPSGDCSVLADYDRALEGAFHNFLLLGTTYYGQEKRWPDSLFWRRRYSTQSEG
jgi:low temperature requirement protein LtrA